MISFIRGFSTTNKPINRVFAKKFLPEIKNIVLVSSCKGGVGKSTIALNTAIAMRKEGAKVGLFDADIYGPSIPVLTGTQGIKVDTDSDGNVIPVKKYDLEIVSPGYLYPPEFPLLWKGSVVQNALITFIKKTKWSELDYLVVDTPPGTGDVHLELSNLLPIDASIMVTTPQQAAFDDVARTVDTYKQSDIPIIGFVTNFNGFTCEHCKTENKIFPYIAPSLMNKDFKLLQMASIPVDTAISNEKDPITLLKPDSTIAKSFQKIAKIIISQVPYK